MICQTQLLVNFVKDLKLRLQLRVLIIQKGELTNHKIPNVTSKICEAVDYSVFFFVINFLNTIKTGQMIVVVILHFE